MKRGKGKLFVRRLMRRPRGPCLVWSYFETSAIDFIAHKDNGQKLKFKARDL